MSRLSCDATDVGMPPLEPHSPPLEQAAEAQRLYREEQERKRIRREKALAELMRLSKPEPLDVDIPALQARKVYRMKRM